MKNEDTTAREKEGEEEEGEEMEDEVLGVTSLVRLVPPEMVGVVTKMAATIYTKK